MSNIAPRFKLQKTAKREGYLDGKSDTDTVVFVHGLRGHYETTWGELPHLLLSDPELPELDVLLWGYKSTGWQPLEHDTEVLGRHLATSLRNKVSDENIIHAVGHSMGGLIILEALVGEMLDLRAQEHPCTAVSWITLYASPVTGSMAGAVVTHTVGAFPGARRLIHKQLRSLAKGGYRDGVMQQALRRIHAPTQEDSGRRRIPIRMVVATQDAAVSESDRNMRLATFNNLAPLEYDCGHSDIKLPTSHHDDRYIALARDLKASLILSFQALCRKRKDPDPLVRDDAEIVIERRFGGVFRCVFIGRIGQPYRFPRLYRLYRATIEDLGIVEARPAADIASNVLMQMRRYGFF